MASTLLKGATLLIHDDDDNITPTLGDLLIEGSQIARIASHVQAPAGCQVIDCSGKIISPGFIDTHRHTWQTAMKAMHADQTLVEYFPCGNSIVNFYTAQDIFWGQLSGCMEAIDAGTTTIVDHAHSLMSPEHAYTTVQASVTSGIRSIFCYCPTPKVANWDPFTLVDENIGNAPWIMETWDKLAAVSTFGQGRVRLGFAFDALYLPAETIQPIYKHLREAGSHLITSHSSLGTMFRNPISTVQVLEQKQLLGPDILLSHANNTLPGDHALFRAAGVHISTTPSTELQLGFGTLSALSDVEPARGSLGIDCPSAVSSYMPLQMNLGLQAERARRQALDNARGKWPRRLDVFVRDAFNLGTVGGARAVKMADRIGRLKEGYMADLVVFDAESPGMLGVAGRDAVAAVVMHSSLRDVEYVFVDGVLRKDKGVLKPVTVAQPPVHGAKGVEGVGDGEVLQWKQVVRKLLQSKEAIDEKSKGVDFRAAEEALIDLFGMNREAMI